MVRIISWSSKWSSRTSSFLCCSWSRCSLLNRLSRILHWIRLKTLLLRAILVNLFLIVIIRALLSWYVRRNVGLFMILYLWIFGCIGNFYLRILNEKVVDIIVNDDISNIRIELLMLSISRYYCLWLWLWNHPSLIV